MHVQKHSPYDWNRQVMFPSIDYKHNNRFNDSNKFMVSVDSTPSHAHMILKPNLRDS